MVHIVRVFVRFKGFLLNYEVNFGELRMAINLFFKEMGVRAVFKMFVLEIFIPVNEFLTACIFKFGFAR